jgi:hypothetical protein
MNEGIVSGPPEVANVHAMPLILRNLAAEAPWSRSAMESTNRLNRRESGACASQLATHAIVHYVNTPLQFA